LASGDREGAERLARGALANDGRDVRSLNLLARLAFEEGNVARGAGLLKRALAAAPFDAEASQLLENLEENEP
jgi:cytochrome c-type biogenesis protein CcmH/NrfG